MVTPKVKKRRKPGPKRTTGPGQLISLKILAPLLKRIDQWAKTNSAMTRQVAMRQLIEMGLAGVARGTQRTSAKTANEASDLAGRMIDVLGDGSAPAEEREKRKRRLLKGPSEFREMRSDHPKQRDRRRETVKSALHDSKALDRSERPQDKCEPRGPVLVRVTRDR